MTEALRNDGSQFHPAAGFHAVNDEVMLNPVDLSGAINVTPGTPRASNGNLSQDMRQGPSFGERAAAIGLAFTIVTGLKLASDGATKGQSPSPAPSIEPSLNPSLTPDPITGVLPSCPPEASPSPTPIVEPTPPIIAVVNGKEFTLIENTVTVRALAQEAPSAPPSVKPSITPGPETAAIDPCATPEPNVSLEPNPSPTPKSELNSVDAALLIMNQKNRTVEKVTNNQIDTSFDRLWEEFGEELTVTIPDTDIKFSKKYFEKDLKIVFNVAKGDSMRGDVASGIVTAMIFLVDQVQNQEAKSSIVNFADLLYDYAANLNIEARKDLNQLIRNRLKYYYVNLPS